jgi:hypothetical protein
MNIRYREPVPCCTGRGGVGDRDRRSWLTVRAEVRSRERKVLAEAESIFMRVSGERLRQLEEIYAPVYDSSERKVLPLDN